MIILHWLTRRACISILAALFVAQWFLISKYLPFSSTATSTNLNASNDIDQDQRRSLLSSQLSQQSQQVIEAGQRNLASFATWTNDQWTQFKEHTVDKVLYQDDGDRTYDESDEMEEIEQTDGSKSPKALGAEVAVVVGVMDDGEKDATYFPGETKFLLDMPHWIPDWLTSKMVHPSALWPPQTDTTTTMDASNQFDYNIAKRDDGDDDDDDDDQTGQSQQQAGQQQKESQKRPPILDLVYTWVNGSDPEWQFSKNIYESKESTLRRINAAKVESRMVGRFRDNDELKHTLRSAYKFGKNVVRKIHISTADVVEEGTWKLWLSEEHQAEQEQQQERGQGNREAPSVPEGEAPKLFKRSRKHFDSWMEFAKKYGVNRTVVKSMEEGDKYIVADEEPPVRPLVLRQTAPGEETGQVPSWLDRSLVSREKIDAAHHSTFFKNKDNLPVFCSVAIESQLYRIPDLGEVFIYMNDDEYFGMELAQSDFWTPHYGLVLQMNPGILVVPHPRDYRDIDPLNRGYMDNLQFTNYILSKRFGYRFRPSLDHIVQVGSRTTFKEIESLWPEAFLQTERSYFRTDYDGNTLSAMFLMAHYTIERLRETQLRSFWRYRVDNNSNGDLEWEERWALVSLIEGWNASGGGVNRERTGQVVDHTPQFLSGFRQVLEQTGYGGTQEQPATRYVFSGMEGFPFMIPEVNTSNTIYKEDRLEAKAMQKLNNDFSVMPADRACIFDMEFCLGPLFMDRRGSLEKRDGEKVFKRLAFEEFHCGDCLLQIAMQSDRGVEYYIERIEDAEESGGWGEHVPFINRQPPVVPGTTDNNDSAEGAKTPEEAADSSSENASNSDNTNYTENADNTEKGDPQTIGDNADTTATSATTDTTDQPPSTDSNNKGNNNGENNIVTKRDDIPSYTTKETIRQQILTAQSQTSYTTHTRGISAILPDPSRHSKARLRIIKDLYKYNFVIGESDSFFVTLVELEKAQHDMAFLDKVKEHDKKLHIVCLNDGIIEERNGTEVRALLTRFLEDRYGDPAPWEKVVAAVDS